MNQILNIKPDKEKNDDDINIDENVLPKKKKLFNIQFSLSIIAILITLSSFLFYIFSLSKKKIFQIYLLIIIIFPNFIQKIQILLTKIMLLVMIQF